MVEAVFLALCEMQLVRGMLFGEQLVVVEVLAPKEHKLAEIVQHGARVHLVRR